MIPPVSSVIPGQGETSQPGDPLHHQSEHPTVSQLEKTGTGMTQPGLKPLHIIIFQLSQTNVDLH